MATLGVRVLGSAEAMPARVGNTIAASIPLALHRSEAQPGETVLLIGTGSGTHYGALLVQW